MELGPCWDPSASFCVQYLCLRILSSAPLFGFSIQPASLLLHKVPRVARKGGLKGELAPLLQLPITNGKWVAHPASTNETTTGRQHASLFWG